MIGHILATQIINLGIDRFRSTRKDLFRCFRSFILPGKVDQDLRIVLNLGYFSFFKWLNVNLRIKMDLLRCLLCFSYVFKWKGVGIYFFVLQACLDFLAIKVGWQWAESQPIDNKFSVVVNNVPFDRHTWVHDPSHLFDKFNICWLDQSKNSLSEYFLKNIY